MNQKSLTGTLRAGFPMALQQFIVSFGFVFIQRVTSIALHNKLKD